MNGNVVLTTPGPWLESAINNEFTTFDDKINAMLIWQQSHSSLDTLDNGHLDTHHAWTTRKNKFFIKFYSSQYHRLNSIYECGTVRFRLDGICGGRQRQLSHWPSNCHAKEKNGKINTILNVSVQLTANPLNVEAKTNGNSKCDVSIVWLHFILKTQVIRIHECFMYNFYRSS